ncbi:MAG: transposase, partial [Planctomycetota bacterium]
KADWFDPEINPKIEEFARHYGTTFLPTKPYTPRHKGKVERGVDYVQSNALKGKDQNAHLLEWEAGVADRRTHGTTRRQVLAHFEESERAALNRAQAEMQNKWLEIIRSRRVMGAETAVKWVWAAMNPKSYSATQTLDEALVGRFAHDEQIVERPPGVDVVRPIRGPDPFALSERLEARLRNVIAEREHLLDVGLHVAEAAQYPGQVVVYGARYVQVDLPAPCRIIIQELQDIYHHRPSLRFAVIDAKLLVDRVDCFLKQKLHTLPDEESLGQNLHQPVDPGAGLSAWWDDQRIEWERRNLSADREDENLLVLVVRDERPVVLLPVKDHELLASHEEVVDDFEDQVCLAGSASAEDAEERI